MATTIGKRQTELIAVENRSHDLIKPIQNYKVSFFDQTGRRIGLRLGLHLKPHMKPYLSRLLK
jgi:hypothetical protein